VARLLPGRSAGGTRRSAAITERGDVLVELRHECAQAIHALCGIGLLPDLERCLASERRGPERHEPRERAPEESADKCTDDGTDERVHGV